LSQPALVDPTVGSPVLASGIETAHHSIAFSHHQEFDDAT